MPLPTAQQRRVKVLEPGWLRYTKRVRALAFQDLIGYWPQGEANGLVANDASGNGRNGAYTGVDLGQTGIGDGRTSAYYDGVNDTCNIYSAAAAAAFNGQEGSLGVWVQVGAAGVWSDATTRYLMAFTLDGNTILWVRKQTSANVIGFNYKAAGTTNTFNYTTAAPLGWFHVAMTWSKSADQVKGYVNGAQVGSTLTGLGTWVGAPVSTGMCIGSSNTVPNSVWSGYLEHAALWKRALSDAEVADLYRVTG